MEPVALHITSRAILAQEDAVISWALDTQLRPSQPSTTVATAGLDVLQGRGGTDGGRA